MTKLFTIITGSLFSCSILAATWTDGTQVVENIMWKPGYHGFYVSAQTYDDPQSCGGTTRLYLIEATTDEKTQDRLYAMLLTAFSTGKTIYIWVDGCEAGVLAPKFTGLQINK